MLPHKWPIEQSIKLGDYIVIGRKELPAPIPDRKHRWTKKGDKFTLDKRYCLPCISMSVVECGYGYTVKMDFLPHDQYPITAGTRHVYSLRGAKMAGENFRDHPTWLSHVNYTYITPDDVKAWLELGGLMPRKDVGFYGKYRFSRIQRLIEIGIAEEIDDKHLGAAYIRRNTRPASKNLYDFLLENEAALWQPF